MPSSKSKLLKLSKKFKILKKIYYFYNIYIRNFKFLKDGAQFNEDKFILSLFEKNFKGKFLDVGCYHPTRHNNTFHHFLLFLTFFLLKCVGFGKIKFFFCRVFYMKISFKSK